jgi:hypothetical protein
MGALRSSMAGRDFVLRGLPKEPYIGRRPGRLMTRAIGRVAGPHVRKSSLSLRLPGTPILAKSCSESLD